MGLSECLGKWFWNKGKRMEWMGWNGSVLMEGIYCLIKPRGEREQNGTVFTMTFSKTALTVFPVTFLCRKS